MVFNGIDKPAELARMLDISPPALSVKLGNVEAIDGKACS
jgi:hypothetical protein